MIVVKLFKMGMALTKAFGRLTKSEQIEKPSYQSIWDIPVKDIDGVIYERIGTLAPNAKALLIVNVASK